MKKKYLVPISILLLSSCNDNDYENLYKTNNYSESHEEQYETYENLETSSENLFAQLGIAYTTREKVLEDFLYMVDRIKENFPFLNALYRFYGINFNQRAETFYRNFPHHQYITIQNSFTLLNQFLRSSSAGHAHVGHLQIISPGFLEFWGGQLMKPGRVGGGVGWLSSFLINPNTLTTYYALGIDILDFFNVPPELGLGITGSSDNYFDFFAKDEMYLNLVPASSRIISSTPNVLFDIPYRNQLYNYLLEQTSTAYVRIDIFNLNYLQANREAMIQFYRDIEHLDNLIIDVRHTAGGYTSVWEELFAFPNIEPGMAVTNDLLPLFLKDTPIVRNSLGSARNIVSYTRYFDFSRFPYIEMGDLENLDLVIDSPNFTFTNHSPRLFPVTEKSVAFEGYIYILIGPGSMSGADAFARFTRATGFATLVGSPSGGIGASWENTGGLATHLPLPNTGLVFRMDLAYGINELGRWNEEQGTTPDIWTMEGKSPLGTVLYHIQNRD